MMNSTHGLYFLTLLTCTGSGIFTFLGDLGPEVEEEGLESEAGATAGAATAGATDWVATTAGADTKLCLLDVLFLVRAVSNCSLFFRTDNTL